MSVVYLNGKYLPLEKAYVPVLDRGFIFGDGVYEVIPAYGGRPFRLRQHLTRLDNSLAGIRLANPLDHGQWETILTELIKRNGGGDLSIYLQITRGAATRDHAFPNDTAPTVFVMCSPIKPAPEDLAAEGVAAITLDDIRWRHCNIKAITLLPNILLRQHAVDAGATEAILIRDGRVTEGAASNVFAVLDGVVVTPAAAADLLPGITRDLVLELANTHAIACREGLITEDDIHRADEIWLTSSTREILPVTRLDDQPVGSGHPGPVWQRINQIYQDYKKSLR